MIISLLLSEFRLSIGKLLLLPPPVIYKLVLRYLKREYRPEIKKVVVKKEVKKLPENYLNVEVPNMVYGNISKPKKEEKIYTYTNAPSMVYGKVSIKDVKPYIEIEAPKLVYGTIPKKYSLDNKTKVYEDMLTLEDYKLLLKLLKEQKIKETKKEVNKPNFTELENLFRGIR